MTGNPALFRQMPALPDEMDETCHRLVPDYHALGFPRGAGGVDHIGFALRHGAVETRRCRIFRQSLRHFLLRENGLRLRILQHVVDAFLRVFRVNGNVARTHLMHGDDSGKEFLHTAHFERNKISRSYAIFQKIIRNAVGSAIQFPIGEGSPAVHNRSLLGRILHMALEQIQPGFPLVICQFFSGGQMQQFLLFFR